MPGTTYGLPDDDVLHLLADVMKRHHRPLHDAGVLVGLLMASNPDGAAVQHGGYPAFASIRVVPLKDRLTKEYDAEMLVDRAEWDRLRPRHRKALVDHELSHLELAKHHYDEPDDGEPKSIFFARDDLGRPKLKLRKGDWNCGDGFAAVVERHGYFAIEYQNLSRVKAYADKAARMGESSEEQEGSDDA